MTHRDKHKFFHPCRCNDFCLQPWNETQFFSIYFNKTHVICLRGEKNVLPLVFLFLVFSRSKEGHLFPHIWKIYLFRVLVSGKNSSKCTYSSLNFTSSAIIINKHLPYPYFICWFFKYWILHPPPLADAGCKVNSAKSGNGNCWLILSFVLNSTQGERHAHTRYTLMNAHRNHHFTSPTPKIRNKSAQSELWLNWCAPGAATAWVKWNFGGPNWPSREGQSLLWKNKVNFFLPSPNVKAVSKL